MNVFYILASYPLKDGNALGNPIDVSVPGIPKDKLSVSCDNGIVKKLVEDGKVSKETGKAKIDVSLPKLMAKKKYGLFRVSE